MSASTAAPTVTTEPVPLAGSYDDGNIATLFTICAETGPQSYYADGSAASTDQAGELSRDAKLEAEGRIFTDDTYQVGEQIKPGSRQWRQVGQ